jgi:hypothetical protein
MNDDFFRRAWLTLKAVSNTKTRKRMDEIEFGIEGIRVKPSPVKQSEEKKNGPNKIIPL